VIDWAGGTIEMKRLTNEVYDDLSKRKYEEANTKLTALIIEARLIRAFINTITRPE